MTGGVMDDIHWKNIVAWTFAALLTVSAWVWNGLANDVKDHNRRIQALELNLAVQQSQFAEIITRLGEIKSDRQGR